MVAGLLGAAVGGLLGAAAGALAVELPGPCEWHRQQPAAGPSMPAQRNTCDVCSWTIFHLPLIRFKRTVQATWASVRFSEEPDDIASVNSPTKTAASGASTETWRRVQVNA